MRHSRYAYEYQQGFEAVKQLLSQSEPYRFILGCRNTTTVQSAYDGLSYDTQKHSVTLLPLELSDLRTVRKFASQTIGKLGSEKLDILFLNAAVSKAADEPGINGSKWSEQYVVNHLCKRTATREFSILLNERLTIRLHSAALPHSSFA